MRRVAARAATSTHLAKQNTVRRIVVSALAAGVDEIVLCREPFRISEGAVADLNAGEHVRFIEIPLTHTDADTAAIATQMREAGCRAVVALGGDGTNRVIAKTWPDVVVLPLSTGTNNVFPVMIEPSVAGLAAGLVAAGKVDTETVTSRVKVLRVSTPSGSDCALVDVVVLAENRLGSLLPPAPEDMKRLLLARAEAAAIGLSPIGGYLMPCRADDDFGVDVALEGPATHRLNVPLSAGYHRTVHVHRADQLAIDEPQTLRGPCVLAYDGDRRTLLAEDEAAVVTLRRDGPRVINVDRVFAAAVENGALAQPA